MSIFRLWYFTNERLTLLELFLYAFIIFYSHFSKLNGKMPISRERISDIINYKTLTHFSKVVAVIDLDSVMPFGEARIIFVRVRVYLTM